MIKNLEHLNSWLISRDKKTMTKNFKETEEFQELMETINKKISAGNSVNTSDNIISPNHYTSDKGFEGFKDEKHGWIEQDYCIFCDYKSAIRTYY